MIRAGRHLAVVSLALLLAACGWQLRGTGGAGFDGVSVAVDGAVGNRILDQVRSQLRDLGAEVETSIADARLVVNILEASSRRRTVATGSDGFAREYELIYHMRFSLSAGGRARENPPIIEPQTVRATASYAASPQALQGQEAEEQVLQEGLAADVIQQMLARIGRQL
ncbi:LPS-assembly lipoprotein LptE [Spiribacter onubensis]|uniref:LPS-assembly lipoprotein LptE n=1 Tax=Spiribacter onubensis TaxID=3122420 RepID=A0ABV3S5M2_9GAMM